MVLLCASNVVCLPSPYILGLHIWLLYNTQSRFALVNLPQFPFDKTPPSVLSTTVQASATPPCGASYATVDRRGKFLFDIFYMCFIDGLLYLRNRSICCLICHRTHS
ncbi:hypothetical protein Hanom_Chr16g01441171 [Helianthus anomalus]